MFSTLAALLVMMELPVGSAPAPVRIPHFPDGLHAFVWRNWELVPIAKMAGVVGGTPDQIRRIGRSMGLAGPPRITPDQQRRSYVTVNRRNWHLLPYSQLLALLDWTEERMAYTLREDDFLYVKLGSLKPKCDLIRYTPPDESTRKRESEIAAIVRREFPSDASIKRTPLFGFVRDLTQPLRTPARPNTQTGLRLCYSYFALYGDPLLDKEADPYPEGYLARLAQSGVNAVWLQGVLYKLAPFPWESGLSDRYLERLQGLRNLVTRAKKHGIRVFLYLNEPRAMPQSFFGAHSDLKGVTEGNYAAMCTSAPEVQKYLREGIASVCRAVPELGGFFTITASENLTNCWSHHHGESCPRCGKRNPAEVVAEVNRLIQEGIEQGGTPGKKPTLIAWDWGWPDAWAAAVIERLPQQVWLMSVSEWDMPINRGGIESRVGEYSLSAIGPGPRALKHWEIAKKRGLTVAAKIQAANSWELSAVPYIPAVANTAEHVANLKEAGIENLMLGWTLGGYPSPNLQAANGEPLESIADKRVGPKYGPKLAAAWKAISKAFAEFPYNIGTVYTAPLQMGPANLLWESPSGYAATMVGIPYDDLRSWRSIYPADIFIQQLQKVASGIDSTGVRLRETIAKPSDAMESEISVMSASAIHFRSVANQARFVAGRDTLAKTKDQRAASLLIGEIESVLKDEIFNARRLYHIQSRDSRIGFEATNHYYYVPTDLMEKVINCRDLLDRWLPEVRRRFARKDAKAQRETRRPDGR